MPSPTFTPGATSQLSYDLPAVCVVVVVVWDQIILSRPSAVLAAAANEKKRKEKKRKEKKRKWNAGRRKWRC